jgi:V8-like Glu-specific endopeptidase
VVAAKTADDPAGNFDSYLERLVKLIPAEVVGAYLVGRELAAQNDATGGWALTCLVFVFIFRALMTQTRLTWRIRSGDIQWTAVFISAVSFVLWVYSFGDHILFFPPCFLDSPNCKWDDLSWVASLGLLLWTPLIPYIYQGDASGDDSPAPAETLVDGTLSPLTTMPQPRAGSGLVEKNGAGLPDAAASVEMPGALSAEVIGRDDRGRVPDAKTAPYASIGLIHAFRGNERMARTVGTGWLLTPHRIVTAGHVVYSPFEFGGRASRVHVWLGFDRYRDDNPAIIASNIRVHPDYIQTGDRRFDVATIDFDGRLAAETDFSGAGSPGGSQMRGREIEIAGYPLDKGGTDMYRATGAVVANELQRVFYDADTRPGQSGAPVWIVEDGHPRVIAVHVDGTALSGHLDRQANLGVCLDEEILNWIRTT